MSLRVVAVVCFVLGVGLLVPFESPVTLALGVGFLVAFVGVGLVALAGPGAALLSDDDEERRGG